MVLFQHALNAANPRPRVHHTFVSLAMAAFAAIICMATFCSRGWAQEQIGNKTLGQCLVDEVASKHRPQLTDLGLHGVTPHCKKKRDLCFGRSGQAWQEIFVRRPSPSGQRNPGYGDEGEIDNGVGTPP